MSINGVMRNANGTCAGVTLREITGRQPSSFVHDCFRRYVQYQPSEGLTLHNHQEAEALSQYTARARTAYVAQVEFLYAELDAFIAEKLQIVCSEGLDGPKYMDILDECSRKYWQVINCLYLLERGDAFRVFFRHFKAELQQDLLILPEADAYREQLRLDYDRGYSRAYPIITSLMPRVSAEEEHRHVQLVVKLAWMGIPSLQDLLLNYYEVNITDDEGTPYFSDKEKSEGINKLAQRGCRKAIEFIANYLLECSHSEDEVRALLLYLINLPVYSNQFIVDMLVLGVALLGEDRVISLDLSEEKRLTALFERAEKGDQFAFSAIYELYTGKNLTLSSGYELAIPSEEKLADLMRLNPKKTQEAVLIAKLQGRTIFGDPLILSKEERLNALDEAMFWYPKSNMLCKLITDPTIPGTFFYEHSYADILKSVSELAKRGNRKARKYLNDCLSSEDLSKNEQLVLLKEIATWSFRRFNDLCTIRGQGPLALRTGEFLHGMRKALNELRAE